MQLGALEYLISVNNSKLKKGIQESDKEIKESGSKLNSWMVAKGQLIAKYTEKALSTLTTLAKSTTKEIVKAYGSYEQLEGGIKKLFGEDVQKEVIKNAKRAFKTAGLSANDYMQTVTEFSASLISSLGGDTAKAAEVSDMAIQDMADNVNVFGSSMESVQNAYRGFSKQNYTMLDNLKLGYGGTRKEMERLLKDAGKLANKKYNIGNLSDVYEAIHVIQENMNITGTTKKEAEGTLEGSIASAKAAWQNVLTEAGKGNWDFKYYVKTFTDVAKNVIKNVKPIATNAIKGLFIIAKELLPEIGTFLKDMLRTVKVSIADMLGLGDDASWFSIGKTIATKLISKAKVKVADLLGIDDAGNATWIDIGGKIVDRIKGGIGTAKMKIADLLGVEADGDAAWSTIGENIIGRIKTGISNRANNIKLKIADILGIENDGDIAWSTIGGDIIERIKTGITNGANNLKLKIADILGIEADGDLTWSTIGGDIIDRIKNGISSGADNLKMKIADLLGIEADGDVAWSTIGSDIVDRIKGGIANGTNSLKLKIADILGIENDGDVAWSTIGSDIVGRIKTGISNGTSSLKLKIADVLGIEDEGDPSWATIGGEISTRLKKGVESAKLKLADLLGIDDSENATWGDIGTKIAEGIGSAFTKGKSYLLKFLLGGDYDESKSDWAQVGEKISGWIEDGFKENGWATKFLDMFGEKWVAIFSTAGNLIQSLADYLSTPEGSNALVTTLVSILTTVTDSAGKIVGPLANALIAIFTSSDFVSALVSLASSLADALISVLQSKDLWNSLTVFFNNLLIDIVGEDSVFGKMLGGKKKLVKAEKPASKGGGTQTKIVSGDDENKADWEKAIEKRGKMILANIVGDFTGERYSLIDIIMGWDEEEKAKQKENAKELSDAYTGYIASHPAYQEVIVHYSSTFWGPNNPDHLIGYYGAGGASQKGLTNVNQTRAKGDWNVSHDMLAQLHQGEMVLTKSQARKYREGDGVDSGAIVSAIQGLRNDMTNLKLVVGRKVFGRAVADYGGEKVNDYIGGAESRLAAGYGT